MPAGGLDDRRGSAPRSAGGWRTGRRTRRRTSTHISITAEVAPASSPRPSILRSAEIMASGFLVSSTEPASASNSRERDSAMRITSDSTQATAMSPMAMRIATPAPPPLRGRRIHQAQAALEHQPEHQLGKERDRARDDHRDHQHAHVAVADVAGAAGRRHLPRRMASWMAAWPRVVLAEGVLDMLRLAYADPALAQRAVLSLFRDAPQPNVPCVFEGGEFNMVAADGSRCGTSPAWCLPFLQPRAAVPAHARSALAGTAVPVPRGVPELVARAPHRRRRLDRLQVHLGIGRGRQPPPGPDRKRRRRHLAAGATGRAAGDDGARRGRAGLLRRRAGSDRRRPALASGRGRLSRADAPPVRPAGWPISRLAGGRGAVSRTAAGSAVLGHRPWTLLGAVADAAVDRRAAGRGRSLAPRRPAVDAVAVVDAEPGRIGRRGWSVRPGSAGWPSRRSIACTA